jgi:inhibitor of growth protein 4
VGGEFADSSSLPAELQRLLSTMRELDERSQNMVAQLREQVKICLMKKRDGPEVDETVDKLRQVIESNQTNALRLCTEKVLLAQQIDSHVKRLDEDLISFAEDLKQEGKIPQDEPAILLSASRDDKRKAHFFTPLGKRIDSRLDRERSLEKERDRERERDRDSELMPPPGSHRKKSLPPPTDIDQPIDPDEPTYCICGQVSFGDMIACDNEECKGGEWFHYQCVGLSSETRFKGKWYCLTCRALQRRGLLEPPL